MDWPRPHRRKGPRANPALSQSRGSLNNAKDGKLPSKELPKAGVVSPLLTNIYLDELDWALTKEGMPMVRYSKSSVSPSDHNLLESRMRENRLAGSEGGATVIPSSQPHRSFSPYGTKPSISFRRDVMTYFAQ
jgi:hypothetical protein